MSLPSTFTPLGKRTVPSTIAPGAVGSSEVLGCALGASCVPDALSPGAAVVRRGRGAAGLSAVCVAPVAAGGGGVGFCGGVCAMAAPARATPATRLPAITNCFISASNVRSGLYRQRTGPGGTKQAKCQEAELWSGEAELWSGKLSCGQLPIP